MGAIYDHHDYVHDWILKVIKSCNKHTQLNNAQNLLPLFERMYKSSAGSIYMKQHQIEQLNAIEVQRFKIRYKKR